MKVNTLASLLVILFSLLIKGDLKTQSTIDWNLVREVDNIKVYTRTSEKSDVKEIRIESFFNTDISTFVNLLKNPYRYTEWVYKCTESRRLETVSEDEFYYYIVTDLPFPVNDRDMIVITKSWIDEADGSINSFSESKPEYLPEDDEYIRVPFYESSWKISATDQNSLFVEYQSITDPGGSLPIWMVNLAITSGPLKTMQALRELLKNP